MTPTTGANGHGTSAAPGRHAAKASWAGYRDERGKARVTASASWAG